MNPSFASYEHVLRAVWPNRRYWNGNRVSSAAFKKGAPLSVNRTGDRTIQDTARFMRTKGLSGKLVQLSVPDCQAAKVVLKYCPTDSDDSHSEIWSSSTVAELNDDQALDLAEYAKIVDEE